MHHEYEPDDPFVWWDEESQRIGGMSVEAFIDEVGSRSLAEPEEMALDTMRWTHDREGFLDAKDLDQLATMFERVLRKEAEDAEHG